MMPDRLIAISLQPRPGRFQTVSDAVTAFVCDPDGWKRHEAGWIVMHDPWCTFAGDPDDRCDCLPVIVARRQGSRPS